MKLRPLRLFRLIPVPLLASAALAADFNWDPAKSSSTSGSGDGTWNTTSDIWYSGGANVVWGNTSADIAIFGGTAPVAPDDPSHAITLANPIVANGITFNTTGYIISGTATNNITLGGTNPTITGNVSGTIASPVDFGSAQLNISGDGGGSDTVTISGQVSGNTIRIAGGRLTLSNSTGNAITGGVTVASGNLTVRGNSTGNAIGGGTLTLAGGSFSTVYNGGGSDSVISNAKANVIFTANSTISVNRNNANSRNTVEMGTLAIGTNTLSLTGGSSYNLWFSGATTLSGNTTFNIASSVGSTDRYGLILSDVGQTGGARNITKSNAGTVGITGTATYTGTTTVSAGGLYLDGNASAATGAITVGASATFGGAGTIGAATTTISGTHAPGSIGSIGTQTFNNALAYAANSSLAWQISAGMVDPGAAALNAGSYDRIIANSTVSGAGSSVFQISLASGAFSDAFWDTDKSWNNIYTNVANLSSIFGTFGGSALADGTVANEGQFSFSGNTLVWTAIPEPSTALLGSVAALALLRRRRK